MKLKTIQYVAAMFSALGMLVPGTGLAATPVAAGAEAVSDVALAPGGHLVGQVVDTAGVAQAGQEVIVLAAGREVLRTATNESGTFVAQGLRGGQYEIVTPQGSSVVRAWAPNTAPPSAQAGTLVIAGDQVLRCNMALSVVEWCRAHPWITTVGVAAAIAIPLALADGDDGPTSP